MPRISISRLVRTTLATLAALAAAPAISLAQAAAPSSAPVADSTPEATSLLGRPLYAPPLSAATRARLEADLARARAAYERAPDDADSIIWLGRRLGYLGRYREAVAVFGEGARKHPRDARMLRHRGHRWITLRRFDRAVEDLTRAAELTAGTPDEVEPDGAPNEHGIPLSTLQGNIWYHLALAHYLRGDFAAAADAWRHDLSLSRNDDTTVATSDWLYMTLRRLGRGDEAARVLAPIRRDMRILENDAYHRRLLMYRGELPADSLLAAGGDDVQVATQGYGVGNWYLYNGQREKAMDVFRRVLALPSWAPFGFIAAEADVARLSAAAGETR
jgi:tetratricopeptide (TPR) repeat protein